MIATTLDTRNAIKIAMYINDATMRNASTWTGKTSKNDKNRRTICYVVNGNLKAVVATANDLLASKGFARTVTTTRGRYARAIANLAK